MAGNPQAPIPFFLSLPCSIHVCTTKPQLTDGESSGKGAAWLLYNPWLFEWEWGYLFQVNLCIGTKILFKMPNEVSINFPDLVVCLKMTEDLGLLRANILNLSAHGAEN